MFAREAKQNRVESTEKGEVVRGENTKKKGGRTIRRPAESDARGLSHAFGKEGERRLRQARSRRGSERRGEAGADAGCPWEGKREWKKERSHRKAAGG